MSDQAQGQSEQPSIRDQIAAVLTPSQEQEQPAAPPEPTGEETPQITEQQAEAPEADPTANWEEVEVNGVRVVVPPEVAKAVMQERDYTQKRQADADYRKALETREQGLNLREKAMQALQPLYVQGQQLEAQIQHMNKLDWDTLRATDPLEYTTKRGDYALLLQHRQQLAQSIQGAHQHVGAQLQNMMVKAVNDATPVIKRHVPDWGTQEGGQRFMKYGESIGASPQELMSVAATPWAVVALEKARKYDELQAGKAQLPKKVQGLSPVAKPGAKSTVQTAEQASYRKNIETLQKSGGKDKNSLRAVIRAKLGT